MFSVAETERLLRITGGKPVTKGQQATYGHLRQAPMSPYAGEGRVGRVLSTDLVLLIARGTLDGITAETGIDEALTVVGLDGVPVRAEIYGITVPSAAGFVADDDGELLALWLRPV